jgi:hypothetical protein
MEILAFGSFVALVIAWLVAPTRTTLTVASELKAAA